MNILEKIVVVKNQEIAILKRQTTIAQLASEIQNLPPPRLFRKVLETNPVHLIAEIKEKSPSVPKFRETFDPLALAKTYEAAGATALSILTDQVFFGGSLARLQKIREVSSLPILRKDFILDPIQIYESRKYGADAILLIAGILSRDQLTALLETAQYLGLASLVEVHTERELQTALACSTEILGINNRNLATFEVSLTTTFELIKSIPENRKRDWVIVSESGIRTRQDIQALKSAGVHATLIGETLLRSENIAQTISELFS